MNETGEFVIVRKNKQINLYLNFPDNESKILYLPGLDTVDNISKQMAIEINGKNDEMENEPLNKIDISDKSNVIDSGVLKMVSRSRVKFKFKLMGSYINRLFVMIAPSWGRWTKNRIWLIINTK